MIFETCPMTRAPLTRVPPLLNEINSAVCPVFSPPEATSSAQRHLLDGNARCEGGLSAADAVQLEVGHLGMRTPQNTRCPP